MPLSHATSLLQNLGDLVDLKILRSHDLANGSNGTGSHLLPQTQAIYAKVQRRPRSPSANTEASKESNNNNNGSGNTNGNGKPRIFHVTLYKDKVYDDYGFSVSDGLYERGSSSTAFGVAVRRTCADCLSLSIGLCRCEKYINIFYNR